MAVASGRSKSKEEFRGAYAVVDINQTAGVAAGGRVMLVLPLRRSTLRVWASTVWWSARSVSAARPWQPRRLAGCHPSHRAEPGRSASASLGHAAARRVRRGDRAGKDPHQASRSWPAAIWERVQEHRGRACRVPQSPSKLLAARILQDDAETLKAW